MKLSDSWSVMRHIEGFSCRKLGASMAIQKVDSIKELMNSKNFIMDCDESDNGFIHIGEYFEQYPYEVSRFVRSINTYLEHTEFRAVLSKNKRDVKIVRTHPNDKHLKKLIERTNMEIGLYLKFGPFIDDLLMELKKNKKHHTYGISINPIFPGNDDHENTIKMGFVYRTELPDEHFIKIAKIVRDTALSYNFNNFYIEQEPKFNDEVSKFYILPGTNTLDLSAT